MPQFGRDKTPVGDVQEPLNLTHQVHLVSIQAPVSIDHSPHPLDQLFPLIERPICIDQGRKAVQISCFTRRGLSELQ